MLHFAASPEASEPSAIGGGSDPSVGPARSPGARSGEGGSPGGGRLTPAGFSGLFQEHHRTLWCIAVAIVRDRDLAYDVVQESAVIALGKLNEFDPATSFAAWCGQIVRFVALNQRKKSARSHVRPTDPTVMSATAPSAADPTPSERAFGGRVGEALDELDPTARACLLMKTVMDMSYRHIAEALGIPEGTAMSHVHRSRQAMRRILSAAASSPAPGPEKEVAP